MPHYVASCHECGTEISARDHCPECNKGHKGSYACPHCKRYILVGDHSIKPDVKRTQEDRLKNIEAAAKEVVAYYEKNPFQSSTLDKLKEALSQDAHFK